MLAALVVVFREALEVGLVIVMLLATTRGMTGTRSAICIGALAGCVGVTLVALGAAQIVGAFDGRGYQIFASGILLAAVVMLGWHVVWTADSARRWMEHVRSLQKRLAPGKSSATAIAALAALAVLREGSETVLYLGTLAMHGVERMHLIAGGTLGVLLAAAISSMIHLGLATISLARVYALSGMLLTLVAAGCAAQAVRYMATAKLISVSSDALWDTSWLIAEDSWLGRLLHIVAGYVARPSATQVAAYAATATAIALLALSRGAPQRPLPRAD